LSGHAIRFEEVAALLKVLRGPDDERRAKEQVEELVRAVQASYTGRPVAEVDAELRRRFAEQAITPQEPAFSEVVRAISEGELP
jgi:hypothetical protein